MKRIVKNYIVRDPSSIVKNIGRNYYSHQFSPLEDGQQYFEDLIQFNTLNDINTTELYVNGVRYQSNTDYTLGENNVLNWINDYTPSTTDVFVFVWR